MLKYRPNISTMNALLRITCGLSMLAWLTAKLVRKPWKDSYMILVIMAAMKVAEGIVRYCPLTALFHKGQELYGDMMDDVVSMDFGSEAEYRHPNFTSEKEES
ncbi:DUF2892 domain-containing protein [Bacillus sp. 1P06AnD]|uniref:YgaP family membrane protein n=1 Tax=Bacillus sp. 1P06AnD TaxID=3132208 RepID=UPI0039A18C27